MSDERYNGWKNRETWAVNLWLSNDQGLYELTRERAAQAADEYTPGQFGPDAVPDYCIGEAIENFVDEFTDPSEGLTSFEWIVNFLKDVGSLWRVDWDEIGAAWLEDVDQ